ncbi:MAG: hydantoinase/carbamoylase family amidase, partial [Halobacteriaceae archaeon]
GGIFDGPLGVYSALEAVRTIKESTTDINRPLEVVCFTEEEGQRFCDGLLGSSVASGYRSVDEALQLEDDSGTTLQEALTSIGYQGEGMLSSAEWDSWLELHVEQGTRLVSQGVSVGVVTDITGITHCEITIKGEANHAGTTSMNDRRDALTAASEIILDVEAIANQVVETESKTAVGTVGSIDVTPNATNVVPGTVTLGLDIRDISSGMIDKIISHIKDSISTVEANRPVDIEFSRSIDLEPTPMHDKCQQAIKQAGNDTGIEVISLHSGAAHDTMHVARTTDSGMLFAPSQGGYSHTPREWTSWEDCAKATEVLMASIIRLSN